MATSVGEMSMDSIHLDQQLRRRFVLIQATFDEGTEEIIDLLILLGKPCCDHFFGDPTQQLDFSHFLHQAR